MSIFCSKNNNNDGEEGLDCGLEKHQAAKNLELKINCKKTEQNQK